MPPSHIRRQYRPITKRANSGPSARQRKIGQQPKIFSYSFSSLNSDLRMKMFVQKKVTAAAVDAMVSRLQGKQKVSAISCHSDDFVHKIIFLG